MTAILLSATNKHYTPAEYLELEEQAEYKSEYRDGEIISMAGATANHNEISGNVYSNFKFGLKGQDYRVYVSDMRLWIPSRRQYTYPDVLLVQGEPIFTDKNTTTVTNARLVVEVLSKSTKNDDRGDKFDHYRSIPELQEYILIDQSCYHLMQYVKTDEKQWLLTDYTQVEDTLKFGSIDFSLTMSDIYDRVNFADIEE